MLMITLYAEQKNRHRFIEQSLKNAFKYSFIFIKILPIISFKMCLIGSKLGILKLFFSTVHNT